MIILNWNTRGLRDLDKRANVRDFIYLFGFDLVVLQETKFCSPTFFTLYSNGGSRINEWVILNPIGASGGQLIGWNGKVFNKISRLSTRFSISVKFKERATQSKKRLHNPLFVSLSYIGQMIYLSSLFSYMTFILFMLGVR